MIGQVESFVSRRAQLRSPGLALLGLCSRVAHRSLELEPRPKANTALYLHRGSVECPAAANGQGPKAIHHLPVMDSHLFEQRVDQRNSGKKGRRQP